MALKTAGAGRLAPQAMSHYSMEGKMQRLNTPLRPTGLGSRMLGPLRPVRREYLLVKEVSLTR